MKKFSLLPAAVLIFCGCSVVFDGSVTGQVVDRERYDEDGAGSAGIAAMTVYLYTDESSWTADYAAWNKGAGILPHQADTQSYFTSTQTDDNGSFAFTGFVWQTLFPEFGKTADRKDVYLLFYHKDYGLQKNIESLRAVSDNTARLPLIQLDDCYNSRWISGKVNKFSDPLEEGMAGVKVEVYIPVKWSYDDDGEIKHDSLVFDDKPDYVLTTDDDGKWKVEASFPMMPSGSMNEKSGIAAVVASEPDYVFKADYNSDNPGTFFADWDFDKDNEVDTCLLSGEILMEENDAVDKGSVFELSDIDLRTESDEAVIEGRVLDAVKNVGEAGVSVRVYVPEKFIPGTALDETQLSAGGYDSSQHFYIETLLDGVRGYLIYRQQPSTTVSTEDNGDFSARIRYKLLPDEGASRGNTRAVVTIKKSGFGTSTAVDASLHAGKDIDGDSIESESDDFYYLTDTIGRGSTYRLPDDLMLRRTEFTQDVEGFYDGGETGFDLNGKTVTLTIIENGVTRTFTARTKTRIYGDGTTPAKPGYFEFKDVYWEEPLSSGDPALYQCIGKFNAGILPEISETIYYDEDKSTVYLD